MGNATVENLENARHGIFRNLLPVIACMILFGATGIVGNIFTFIFYTFKSKRSTTVMLIACLAMVDLIVCILFVPNIIEMWVNVTYTASFVCKLAHFVGLWTVACSGLILWVVAIDRHRKICCPFGKQMTLVTTKYAVSAIVVFGFALSVRNFANFDSVKVNVEQNDMNITLHGHYCTTRDDDSYTASVAVFTVVDFLIVLMICLTLAVAYSHIIYTIFKLKRTRKRLHQKPKVSEIEISNSLHESEWKDELSTNKPQQGYLVFQPTSDDKDNENRKVGSKSYINGEQKSDLDISAEDSRHCILSRDSNTRTSPSIQYSQPNDEYTSDCPSLCDTGHSHDEETLSPGGHSRFGLHQGHKKLKRYNSAKSAAERNLTFKMLAVSIVFMVCFVPYFVVKILMREVLKTGEEYELNLWAQISLRLPYMNSVFNPVVYCVFNPQFRLYIKGLFLGSVTKCFRKTE